MTEMFTEKAITQLRRAGLVQPRPPHPGKRWTPRTDAEQHLLHEGYRLDRLRLVLLEEIGRLRQQTAGMPRREVLAAAARSAARLKECPLTASELEHLTAAAAGELPEETAHRLGLSYSTVKTGRQRAATRLGARGITHAVALAVAAGWIPGEQLPGGVTP